MLKMGTYGLVRFCVPMFPNAARSCSSWIIPLAIIGIVYGALVAMVQPNMKKLVAYSSVSHLGFVVLGIFSFTQLGMDGAVYQMLNHGISTGALFVLVGFLYERRHSLEIEDYGGVATVAPWLSTVFLITTLASIGLPTLNNFIGEFLVLQGSAQVNILWTVFASLGVILSACYMLWLYQRVFYGKASEEVEHHMPDLTGREWACMVPLIIMMVWMGTYTQTFLTPVTKATARLLEQAIAQRHARADATQPIAAQYPQEAPSMPTNWMPTSAEYLRFLPEIILTLAGTLLMVHGRHQRAARQPAVRQHHDRRADRRHRGFGVRVLGSRTGILRHAAGRRLRDLLPHPGHRRRDSGGALVSIAISIVRTPSRANITR